MAEDVWLNVLQKWVPQGYSVLKRKYVIPEIGRDEFESDLVIVRPSYPAELHAESHILAGGVAAVFSVKNTLDADGIKDAFDRAVRLKRGVIKGSESPGDQLLALFPVGLLASSHNWKKPESTPRENVTRTLRSLEGQAVHPRELLDSACVADLGTWSLMVSTHLPGFLLQSFTDDPVIVHEGGTGTAMMEGKSADTEPLPLARLLAHLWGRLSHSDPSLIPMADNLRLTGVLGSGEGSPMKAWRLDDVFDQKIKSDILAGNVLKAEMHFY